VAVVRGRSAGAGERGGTAEADVRGGRNGPGTFPGSFPGVPPVVGGVSGKRAEATGGGGGTTAARGRMELEPAAPSADAGPDGCGPDVSGTDVHGPDTFGPDTFGPDTFGPDIFEADGLAVDGIGPDGTDRGARCASVRCASVVMATHPPSSPFTAARVPAVEPARTEANRNRSEHIEAFRPFCPSRPSMPLPALSGEGVPARARHSTG
jgi:hypothetical protein